MGYANEKREGKGVSYIMKQQLEPLFLRRGRSETARLRNRIVLTSSGGTKPVGMDGK